MMPAVNGMASPLAASYPNEESVLCASLPKMWQTWAREVLPGSDEKRDMAVERLKDCLAHRSPWLDLSDLQLTALPDHFPDFLEELNLNYNRLSCVPDTLPKTIRVLAVGHNQLTVLPETLPDSLDVLCVSHNQLCCLTASLPDSITVLDVAHNQLTVLPDTLPESLDVMRVSYNQLTRLPDQLPEFMGVLYANNNQLSCLPDQLPNLSELHVNNNLLTHLPATLPISLEILQIGNNPLQQLSGRVLDSFDVLNVVTDDLWDVASNTLSGFLAKIQCWGNDVDKAIWERIYTEEHAEIFADFLYKLHQGQNSQNDALRYRIASWLAYLVKEEHGELRKQTFMVAQETTESCVDRASFYFNHMHILMVEHQLLSCDAPPEQVVETIRGAFRLQVLERLAAEKAAARRRISPGFAEDLEIYLAYQCALHDSLSLPIYTDMQFTDIAGITEEDSCQALEAVMTAEKTDFGRYWLTESALWTAKLASWNPEKKAAADHRYLEAISADSFNKAVNKMLSDKGMPAEDSDVQRMLSQALAADLFYQQRYQLTQEYLADRQAVFLMEHCHSLSFMDNAHYIDIIQGKEGA